MFLALIFIVVFLIYLTTKCKGRQWQIMRYYNKTKNKIVIPRDVFFHYRHCDGYLENNGLWFPRGYQNPPVFNSPEGQIEVEFLEDKVRANRKGKIMTATQLRLLAIKYRDGLLRCNVSKERAEILFNGILDFINTKCEEV
jgi:hypothetical protein